MWSPLVEKLQLQTLFITAIHFIYFFIHVQGSDLEECHLKTHRCIDSTEMLETYHCHTHGHFPHPTNATVFLRCPGPGYKACLCRCKYEQMCFDVKKNTCKFEFLGDLIDCSRPLAFPISGAVTRIHPPVLIPNIYHNYQELIKNTQNITNNNINNNNKTITKSVFPVEQNQISSKTAKDTNNKNHVDRAGDLHLTEIIHEHSLVHTNPNRKPHSAHMHNSTLSARQVAKPLKLLIHDHSSFPTWAIALVVLCIIILLVLIVLLMY